jgi:hypothetical protein
MKLSRRAAEELAENLEREGEIIVRIEGGVWHDPGFEARLDEIWDAVVRPNTSQTLYDFTNLDALNFIKTRSSLIDTFILTSVKLRQLNDQEGALPPMGST